MPEPHLAVGDRVEDLKDGQRGSVRFCGEVPPSSGLWLGVEWDHPELRGRHDGTHQGVRYFTPKNEGAGAGCSFVRRERVSGGVAFLDALERRYGKVEGETAGVDQDELAQLKLEINAPFVQVVGFDKLNRLQSDFAKLKIVSLRRCSVFGIGTSDPMHLQHRLQSVRSLDLSENLIKSWLDLVKIISPLPKLVKLNVSDNRMSLDQSSLEEVAAALRPLQELVMGDMDFSWTDVEAIVKMTPDLTVLHIYSNQIASIRPFSGYLEQLTELNLNNNRLSGWEDVLKFSHLRQLEFISVSSCGLQKLFFPPDTDYSQYFAKLRRLYVAYNEINDWQSFSALDQLMQLEELRCNSNPIVESVNTDTARQWIIASVHRLKNLNGGLIERWERFGAEVDYLKLLGKEYLAALRDPQLLADFCNSYPRYSIYVAKYGAVEESQLTTEEANVKSSLILVNLQFGSNLFQVTKKLPRTMTVQKLRQLLHRLLKAQRGVAADMTPNQLILSTVSSRAPGVHLSLDNDLRDLFFYSVEDNDSICIGW